MSGRNLLEAIILVSEKAAILARAIRQEEHLLSLLVREKKGDEKNPRFDQDFKTLADVLVQEVVKNDLGNVFPDLVGNIYGEESNEFSCLDGEMLCLSVGSTEEELCSQLMKILGDEPAAKSLSLLVNSATNMDLEIPDCDLPTSNLAVWIDPIDSTAEYIAGGETESEVAGVFASGLPCVTVLIGAFDKSTGQPVLGVVNQPFHQQADDRWRGKIVWGISHNGVNLTSDLQLSSPSENKIVVLSSSESAEVKNKLIGAGFTLVEAAGAGYKLFCVATHRVSAYILSKPSTFYWDTCGVNAVLCALGGGVVSYRALVRGESQPLVYRGGKGTEECCNAEGFVAYRSKHVLETIADCLKE